MAERQEFLRNVLELDEEGLSNSELALVEQRLPAYQSGHSRALRADIMAERVRSRFCLRVQLPEIMLKFSEHAHFAASEREIPIEWVERVKHRGFACRTRGMQNCSDSTDQFKNSATGFFAWS